jgi:NAD(P)-dependent dehydrogenase (short-subunit alcohol dehydrogenase family)
VGRPSDSLAGRAVIVTGAARGIGAKTARLLAARGARVALVGREPAELERRASEFPGAIWREVDVADAAAMSEAFDAVAVELGAVDAVVANAGICSVGTIRTLLPEAFARSLEVNVLGVVNTARAALSHLERSAGYLQVVASVVALVQAPGLGAYAPTKAAVEAFANVLRLEAAVRGVDVGTAYFSLIDTDMMRGFDESPIGGHLHRSLPPLLGRMYSPTQAAEALVRGIEHRSRRVVWPRWLSAALPLRGLAQPVVDRYLRRLMPALDRLSEDDVARRGAAAASAPVGAGGRADGGSPS